MHSINTVVGPLGGRGWESCAACSWRVVTSCVPEATSGPDGSVALSPSAARSRRRRQAPPDDAPFGRAGPLARVSGALDTLRTRSQERSHVLKRPSKGRAASGRRGWGGCGLGLTVPEYGRAPASSEWAAHFRPSSEWVGPPQATVQHVGPLCTGRAPSHRVLHVCYVEHSVGGDT